MLKIKMDLNNIKEVVLKGANKVINKINSSNAIDTFRQIKVDRLLSTGKLVDIGHVINASENLSAMFSLPNNKFKKLMHIYLKAIADNNNIIVNNIDGKKYIGLLNFSQEINGKNGSKIILNVSIIDEEIQLWILNEMYNCDLNDISNLRKIATDCNVIYRLLGERTIDAFKKFYELNLYFMQDVIKAKSVLHFKDNIDTISYDKLGTIGYSYELSYVTKYASLLDVNGKMLNTTELQLGDYLKYDVTNVYDEDNQYCYFYEDAISNIRESIRYAFQIFINKDVPVYYSNADISNASLVKLNKNYFALTRSLYVTPYSIAQRNKIVELKNISNQFDIDADSDAYIEAKEEIYNNFNATIDNISNEFRTFVKLSNMTPEEAGELMYTISNYKLNIATDMYEVKANQCFLNVAPEYFISYYANRFNKTKAYAKLYGNIQDLDKYITNNTVNIKDGYVVGSDLSISSDCKYTGIANVEYVWDKDYTKQEPYIYIPLNSLLFNDIDTSSNRIKAIIYKTAFIDIESTKDSNKTEFFKNDPTVLFNRLLADPNVTFKFLPIYKYARKSDSKIITLNSVLVAIKDGKTLPVACYSCYSNEIQSVYAGIQINSKCIEVVDDKLSISITFDLEDAIRDTSVQLVDYGVSKEENEKMSTNVNVDDGFSKNNESLSSDCFGDNDDSDATLSEDISSFDVDSDADFDDDFGLDIDSALDEFDEINK